MDFIRKSITNTHKQEINLLSLSCYFLFVGVSGHDFNRDDTNFHEICLKFQFVSDFSYKNRSRIGG